MGFTAIGFVLAMCAMGAGIAALADTVGRNIGKRKHSVYRLRPRHTAALFAAVAGFLIPFFTIGLLSLVSTDVRRMLAESATIEQQLRKLQGDQRVLEARLEQGNQELTTVQREKAQLDSRVSNLSDVNNKLENENKGLESQSASARKELESERRTVVSARREAEQSKRELSTLNAKSQALAKNVEKLRADITAKTTAVDTLENQRKKIERELRSIQDSNQQLYIAEQQLSARITGLQGEITDLKNQAEREGRNKLQLESQIKDRETELQSLQATRQTLADEISQLRELSRTLTSSLTDLRSLPMTFAISQEIARFVVEPRRSEDEARIAFNRFKSLARERAKKAGAGMDEFGDYVNFIPYRDERRRVEVSALDQEREVIRSITNRPDEVVLIATARVNSFAGEYVRWTVRDYDNTIVYREGEVLAEIRVNGSNTSEEIFEQLKELISVRVATRARADRLIPAQGSDTPLGEVSEQTLLQLIAEIQGTQRIVRVQAVAAQETRRADPLRLGFRIR